MSEPTPGALSAGQIFYGRYEIVRCLKSGGMGTVYECIHLKTRKRRALKVMLPQILANAAMRERFELEARVTADIESEHVVETFDAGVDEATGAPFLVMELLRGEDLAGIVERRGPLPASETVLLLSQAALALDKTHAAGIVHRDLKPDNLFVTRRDDGSPRLKILDFGIAKVVADVGQAVKHTAMIGTPLYMSHEQILGEGTIGLRADVYAMGQIAFTLLTGRPYWADEQQSSPAIYAFLGKVMAGASEPATARAARCGVTLPPAFDAWFARATARAARDRFEGASMLVDELARALGVSAPRPASLPIVSGDPRAVAPSLAGSTPRLEEPRQATELVGTPARFMNERTTGMVSSQSIGSISRRSRLPFIVMAGVGALGLSGLGLLSRIEAEVHAPSPTVSLAATAAMAADTSTAAISAPDPAPASTPNVTPAEASSAPRRPALAPPRPVTPTQGCNPPYVMNSAGHRVMKPQCL